jgi:hypothetical protein
VAAPSCVILLQEGGLQVFKGIVNTEGGAAECRRSFGSGGLAHAYARCTSVFEAEGFADLLARLLTGHGHRAASTCVGSPAGADAVHAEAPAAAVAGAAHLVAVRASHRICANDVAAICTIVAHIACAHPVHTQALS